MCDLISRDPDVIQVISRFNLPLGVGEKTIEEVCADHGVDSLTFLAIVNYKTEGANQPALDYESLSLPDIVAYLRNAHSYFFQFSLPKLRQKLIESIRPEEGEESRIPMLIIKFYDEYVKEINIHMSHENEQLFPYIERLLRGENPIAENLDKYEHQHNVLDDQHIASKLSELKNLIIKYYPATCQNVLLNSALLDIFQTEQDLANHCAIEDNILLPTVRALERRGRRVITDYHQEQEEVHETLSEREIDVLKQLVNGLSNKEIADVLCISTHTVISHRKNIANKLNIRSTAGLTIYAIVNSIVRVEDLKLT